MSAGDGTAPRALSVALVTYSTKPRGGVVHTVELGEALHDLGVKVCIYALAKDPGGFYRLPRCPHALVPAAPAREGIDAVVAQRIDEFIVGLRAFEGAGTLWHAQDCISANALAVLRDEGWCAHFIRTVHHLDDFDSAYLRACQERSVRAADRCVAVSAVWQGALREAFGVEAPIIPNGVDSRRFKPAPDGAEGALRRRLGVTGSPVYLTVGGVEPRKNSIVLLRAFLEVRRRLPGAQLIIAGGETLFDHAPYQREFQAIAREAGLLSEHGGGGSALVLAGVLPDEVMPALYRIADAFVFPSIREGFGIALLEAMASGVPVVSSAQPPFTEFLTDGESALLVDPRRAGDLARAMEAAVQGEIGGRIRAGGLAASDRYTWERSARAAAAIYGEFLERRTQS